MSHFLEGFTQESEELEKTAIRIIPSKIPTKWLLYALLGGAGLTMAAPSILSGLSASVPLMLMGRQMRKQPPMETHPIDMYGPNQSYVPPPLQYRQGG